MQLSAAIIMAWCGDGRSSCCIDAINTLSTPLPPPLSSRLGVLLAVTIINACRRRGKGQGEEEQERGGGEKRRLIDKMCERYSKFQTVRAGHRIAMRRRRRRRGLEGEEFNQRTHGRGGGEKFNPGSIFSFFIASSAHSSLPIADTALSPARLSPLGLNAIPTVNKPASLHHVGDHPPPSNT